MRMIDADKLEELCDIMAEKCGDIEKSIWNQFRTTVEWSPTVDAVPVVRCKDCKHNSLKRMSGNTYCDIGMGLFQLYDFCSKGERRTDGGSNLQG